MSFNKLMLSFALGCLAMLTVACGQNQDSILSQNPVGIFGGDEVTVTSNLWRASVGIKSDSNTCSGVLITPYMILTAGHCMSTFEESNGLTLLFFKGSNVVSKVVLNADDYDLVTHPDFDEDGTIAQESPHDMGLVIVSHNVAPSTHKAPPFYSGKLQAGDELVTVGNGLTENGSNTTGLGMLRYVKSRLKSFSSNDGGRTAQAFSLTRADEGTCGGDSGGAVYVQTPTEGLKLVGIHVSANDNLSSEIGCGQKTGISILTNSMRRWIKSHL